MTDSPGSESAEVAYEVELSPQELALIRMSLRLLLSTLGREEADEIEEIKAVLARLPNVPPPTDIGR
jgi:hypothetical protein